MLHTTRRTAGRTVRGGRGGLRLLLCAVSFLIIGTAFLAMPLAVSADHGSGGNGTSMGDDHGNDGNGAGVRDRRDDNGTKGVDQDINDQRNDDDAIDKDAGNGAGITMDNDHVRNAGKGNAMGTITRMDKDDAAGTPGMDDNNNANDDRGADRNDNDDVAMLPMGGMAPMPVVRDDDR